MNGKNGKQSDYPKSPCSLSRHCGGEQRRPDAMKIVLQHFSGYIASLSMRKLYDERQRLLWR